MKYVDTLYFIATTFTKENLFCCCCFGDLFSNCLSVFDNSVVLALKGLSLQIWSDAYWFQLNYSYWDMGIKSFLERRWLNINQQLYRE